MAIHDDLLPQLQTQLADAQNARNDFIAAELSARIAQETEKRQRWAVCDLPCILTLKLILC